MGGVGSGGPNGGPQYDPTNVSGTGGDGQSGMNYSGFAYGQNKAINEQKQAAPLAETSSPTAAGQSVASMLPEVTPLTAESQFPNQNIMDGSPIGPGAGPEALNLPMQPTGDAGNDLIRQYLPIMQVWADMPGASDDTKEYVRYLGTVVQGINPQ